MKNIDKFSGVMATVHLKKEDFVRRVADIDNGSGSFEFLGDKPALLDFYAEWCGPCRMLSPVLEELSDEYAGKVDMYKINIDEEEMLASVFGIRSIPTLIFVPMNGKMQRINGAVGKSQLKDAIENILLR